MNGHHHVFSMPESNINTLTVPLLDDEFDLGEEEILDHSEVLPLHFGHTVEEESFS
jgi:hypothetical protein